MARVRFPDGSRRKVERADKSDALNDLEALVAQRKLVGIPEPPKVRDATFTEVIAEWFDAGCPNVAPTRSSRHARHKSPNTIANARQLLGTSVLPKIGKNGVDRTTTQHLEALFEAMADAGYATSTIDRNWNYLNQALQHGRRNRHIKSNPAVAVLLPERRPSKQRKSLSLEEAKALVTDAIPNDPRSAMWLTGLMCGLRPGELVGLRWPYVALCG